MHCITFHWWSGSWRLLTERFILCGMRWIDTGGLGGQAAQRNEVCAFYECLRDFYYVAVELLHPGSASGSVDTGWSGQVFNLVEAGPCPAQASLC